MILSPQPARAETVAWAVLPIRAKTPPTSDPTLLRLTEEIGRAVHEVVSGPVRVVSRELRDETCPSNEARCPNDITSLLRAERALSLWLDDGHGRLMLRVYRALHGIEKEFEIPCTRQEGKIHCETKSFAKKLRTPRAKLAPEEVNSAFGALSARLEACRQRPVKGPTRKLPKKVEVRFELDHRGRATHVRIEPRRIQGQAPFQCMARVVEELDLRKDGRALGPLRFPLPVSNPASP
jgi:hypothetical protein